MVKGFRLPLLTVLLVAVFVLTGCVVTAPPPGVALLPTATAAPTDTPMPTATSAPPTATPVAATPPLPTATLPPPDFAPEDVLGYWTRSDPDRGQLYLYFKEDGTYEAAHGTTEGIVHTGTYQLDGRLLSWLSGWDGCFDDGQPHEYALRMLNNTRWLYFDLVTDGCEDTADALPRYRWDRYTPTGY